MTNSWKCTVCDALNLSVRRICGGCYKGTKEASKPLGEVIVWASSNPDIAYASFGGFGGVALPFEVKPVSRTRTILLPSDWHEAAFAACVTAYRTLQAQHPELDCVLTMDEVKE